MSISNYTDFVATTGPAILTGPESVINEAVNKSYLMSLFIKGKPMKELLQGGQTIDDVIPKSIDLKVRNGIAENFRKYARARLKNVVTMIQTIDKTPANDSLGLKSILSMIDNPLDTEEYDAACSLVAGMVVGHEYTQIDDLVVELRRGGGY